jgi:UDP-N-acetylmuramoyl-tripeptide--D-alanyl-D-alanine ligase
MIGKLRAGCCVLSDFRAAGASITRNTRIIKRFMQLSLAQVQAATSAETCASGLDQILVTGWSIDSRTTSAGDLFIAISGERFDGHAFIDTAFERGASAALVSESATSKGRPVLKVRNTIQALSDLARWARQKWNGTVVGVTGSAGKTSTKDIAAACLGTRFRVAKTVGNLNNHIGLPLSLLRTQEDAEIAVLEMGMNHAGEIRHLASIAAPHVGIVTNVGYAHIENFGSIDGIAAAKRELIESLPESGTAVLNADDERVAGFRRVHRGRTITYGLADGAEVRAMNIETHPDNVQFVCRGVRFRAPLIGCHAVSNILAGLAVASAFDIPFEALVDAVAHLAPGKMRGERLERRGIVILDDCYNSNPEAARKMLDVLRGETAARRIAVLGEMLELGGFSESLHRDLGDYAARAGIDVVIGIRGAARHTVEAARRAGLGANAVFFEEPEEAGTFLREFARPGDAILFKGSRGTHVERALATMEVS